MNQTQAAPQSKEVPPPKQVEPRRLVSCSFIKPVTFNGMGSVSLANAAGLGAGNLAESIEPACIDASGDAVPAVAKSSSQGLLVCRRAAAGGGKTTVQRFFVPWANIAEVIYG